MRRESMEGGVVQAAPAAATRPAARENPLLPIRLSQRVPRDVMDGVMGGDAGMLVVVRLGVALGVTEARPPPLAWTSQALWISAVVCTAALARGPPPAAVCAAPAPI